MKIYILGTAGGRYVVAKQLKASAGTVLEEKNEFLLLDPGPGTLVYLAKHKISVEKIKTVLLSHKHLDHSSDLNILIDAITEGTLKRQGRLFLPREALEEGLLLPYLQKSLEELVLLDEKKSYSSGPFYFSTTRKLFHRAENYGFIFTLENNEKLAFLTDTAYFEELVEDLKDCSYLILNVVRFESKEGVLHLSVKDTKRLLTRLKPKLAILTHFGMTMLKANPFKVAQDLSAELNLKVISAYDGLKLSLP